MLNPANQLLTFFPGVFKSSEDSPFVHAIVSSSSKYYTAYTIVRLPWQKISPHVDPPVCQMQSAPCNFIFLGLPQIRSSLLLFVLFSKLLKIPVTPCPLIAIFGVTSRNKALALLLIRVAATVHHSLPQSVSLSLENKSLYSDTNQWWTTNCSYQIQNGLKPKTWRLNISWW